MNNLTTETKPSIGGPSSHERMGPWLVIRTQVIVATIDAHCIGCAFKVRDEKYPGTELALPLDGTTFDYNLCNREVNAMDKVEYYMRRTGANRDVAERWAQWRKETRESARRLGLT